MIQQTEYRLRVLQENEQLHLDVAMPGVTMIAYCGRRPQGVVDGREHGRYRLDVVLRPPEFMRETFVLRYGGTEQIAVRGETVKALTRVVENNCLIGHPRLLNLTIYEPERRRRSRVEDDISRKKPVWELELGGNELASVWSNGTWHTWDARGYGGENACERTIGDAIRKAIAALVRQQQNPTRDWRKHRGVMRVLVDLNRTHGAVSSPPTAASPKTQMPKETEHG